MQDRRGRAGFAHVSGIGCESAEVGGTSASGQNARDFFHPNAWLHRDISRALTKLAQAFLDIANDESYDPAYILYLLRLPWLAPDSATSIVNGRQPRQLNAKTLMRKASRLPPDWTEQR